MRTVTTVIVLFLIHASLGAQHIHDSSTAHRLKAEPVCVNFTIDNGLPDNTVHDVYCDSIGIIWLATEHGVASYNGLDFQYFNQSNGLSDNDILRLIPLSNNEIWLGTYNGTLNYIKNNQAYQLNKESAKDFIMSALRDKDKNIWISARNELLRIQQDGKVLKREFFTSPYLINWQDKILCLAGNKGLMEIDPQGLTMKTKVPFKAEGWHKPSRHQNKLYTLSYHEKEQKYKQIIINLDSLTFQERELPTLINRPNYQIHAVKYIKGKTYWCTSNGLFIAQDGRIQEERLRGTKITSVCMDKEGGLWVSAVNKGVFYYPFTSARHWFEMDQQKKPLTALSQANSHLTVGNKQCFFRKGNRQSWQNIHTTPLYCNINSIVEGNKKFAILSDESLILIDQINKKSNKYKIYGARHALFKKDTLILATHSATYAIEIDSLQHFAENYQPENANIISPIISSRILLPYKTYTLKALKKGQLALLSKNGLFFYQRNRLNAAKEIHEKLNGKIGSMAYDGDSILWLSTEKNGLIRFNTLTQGIRSEKRVNYTSNKRIRTLNFDALQNMLFIGSNHGVDILHGKMRYTLSTKNGLPSSSVDALTTFADTLYVLTSGGLFSIALDELKNTQQEISLQFETLQIDGQEFKSFNIRTAYNKNNLIFKTSVSSLRQAVKFYFQINNKPWKKNLNGNIIMENLAQGKYTLNIKAVSDNQQESNWLTFHIVVSPPFWKSKWFDALLILTLSLLAYGFFKLKVLAYNKDVVYEILTLVSHKLKASKHIELKNAMDGSKSIVELDTIERLEGAKDYVKVYLTNRTLFVKTSLKKLLEEMNQLAKKESFIQTHKSHIVRLDKVEGQHYQFVLVNKQRIPIGRSYKTQVAEKLTVYQEKKPWLQSLLSFIR